MTDKQLFKFTKGFTLGITGGDVKSKCYMVCLPLFTCLIAQGVVCELIKGEVNTSENIWIHYWIKLNDGRILDPTASQLGLSLPMIYLGEKPEQYTEV